jgi:hypothetical protein
VEIANAWLVQFRYLLLLAIEIADALSIETSVGEHLRDQAWARKDFRLRFSEGVILVIVVGTIRLVGSNANNVFSSVASSVN